MADTTQRLTEWEQCDAERFADRPPEELIRWLRGMRLSTPSAYHWVINVLIARLIERSI